MDTCKSNFNLNIFHRKWHLKTFQELKKKIDSNIIIKKSDQSNLFLFNQ